MTPIDGTPHNVDYFEDLTGEIPRSDTPKPEAAGSRIKKIREEKGLSLEYLSKLTGVDKALLEKIETGEVNPQLGTIAKLSKALESAFPRMVSGSGGKRLSITRKNQEQPVVRATSHQGKSELYRYQSLAHDVEGRRMEPLIVTLNEHPEKEPSVHDGEEFIYVLEGEVLGQVGEETVELKPGDTLYYLSSTPHFLAAKSGKAKILAVLYE